jgi:DNA repair protein RadA/Sms
VTRIEQRIGEAQKLGFETIVIPKHNLKGIKRDGFTIRLVEVGKVEETFRFLFG